MMPVASSTIFGGSESLKSEAWCLKWSSSSLHNSVFCGCCIVWQKGVRKMYHAVILGWVDI